MLKENIIKNCEKFIEQKRLLEEKLSDVDVINNSQLYKELILEYNKIKEIVDIYLSLKTKYLEIETLEKEILLTQDVEYKNLIKEEIKNINKDIKVTENKLLELLIPPQPETKKNVILEIRAGTGGEEAALFAADLFRMYSRYCMKKNWKLEIMDINQTGLKGIKEVICYVSGKDVYKYLQYESGVHRVQRIPQTESSGRIHTSAATVAVLPEAEEVDVEIRPEDIEIETFRASGHGGQHLQKTDSAVRIRHKPTGLVVQCQDERSQIKNRERAMKILRAKLYDMKLQQQQQQIALLRKSQVKSGDRSEKIRTYNFPQNRVTDHRINLTLYNLQEILDGELDEIINSLLQAELNEKLEQIESISF
ncbi:MAG: peptide chain release factor 1 [Elusimicrobiota bacterium]|nr:peptide chain release factor 1 [Endomicrobiia bacterium]MCX7910574.1 peptide chain release factor 1 [Endomicrobiia bacterium]MDW8164886.1 peptide chain release factor 1 [Elusimicrobiota bacterium]